MGSVTAGSSIRCSCVVCFEDQLLLSARSCSRPCGAPVVKGPRGEFVLKKLLCECGSELVILVMFRVFWSGAEAKQRVWWARREGTVSCLQHITLKSALCRLVVTRWGSSRRGGTGGHCEPRCACPAAAVFVCPAATNL